MLRRGAKRGRREEGRGQSVLGSDRREATTLTTDPVVGVVEVVHGVQSRSVPCKSDGNHVEMRLGFSALNPGPISPVDPKGQQSQ